MFNLFPLFGNSGDSTSSETHIGKQPWPNWSYTTTTIKDKDGKDVTVQELIEKFNRLSESVEHLRGEAEKFYEENKKLKDQLNSIEEDGTEEHNAAVKLRQENAQLKVEIDSLKNSVMVWRKIYDEKADAVDELMKEVNGLRHLKEENVRLIDRVNEIDSDQNEEYRAEVFRLRNDNAVWKAKHGALLEKYNGTVAMGGLKYMEAKLQIVQNNYKKCTEERDEFKHQLNAANKENKALKNDKEYWKEQFDEVTELLHTLKKEYEERLKELNNSVVDVNNENKTLKKEKAILERWKHEQLIVNEMWDKVDLYVRDHDDAPLGGFTANTCLNFLKERDELKKRIDGLSLTIDRKNFEIDELKAEIKKLKEDIVDYVIEKDDKLNEAKETIDALKNMKTQGFEDYDPCGFEKQKHPMYPLHWGGIDEEKTKQRELYGVEEPWQCPCNKCKDKREDKSEKSWEEAASDLALRVAKLEEQLKYTQKINFKE